MFLQHIFLYRRYSGFHKKWFRSENGWLFSTLCLCLLYWGQLAESLFEEFTISFLETVLFLWWQRSYGYNLSDLFYFSGGQIISRPVRRDIRRDATYSTMRQIAVVRSAWNPLDNKGIKEARLHTTTLSRTYKKMCNIRGMSFMSKIRSMSFAKHSQKKSIPQEIASSSKLPGRSWSCMLACARGSYSKKGF